MVVAAAGAGAEGVVAAKSRATVLRNAAPAATAIHAKRTRYSTRRVGGGSGRIRTIPIGTPFTHVAVHIV